MHFQALQRVNREKGEKIHIYASLRYQRQNVSWEKVEPSWTVCYPTAMVADSW